MNGRITIAVQDGNVKVDLGGLNRREALRLLAETLLGIAVAEEPQKSVVQQVTPGMLGAILASAKQGG